MKDMSGSQLAKVTGSVEDNLGVEDLVCKGELTVDMFGGGVGGAWNFRSWGGNERFSEAHLLEGMVTPSVSSGRETLTELSVYSG